MSICLISLAVYLLSNNHINDLISAPFNDSHEELLGYHISLLKTLSLSFNRATIQFFYSRRPRTQKEKGAIGAGGAADNARNDTIGIDESFPLYTRAIQYSSHEETMVRTAVRTITLNVFSTADASVRRFLLKGEHGALPRLLANGLLRAVRRLSDAVLEWQARLRDDGLDGAPPAPGHPPTTASVVDPLLPPTAPSQASGSPRRQLSPERLRGAVSSCLSDVLDELFYLQDVMAIAQAEVVPPSSSSRGERSEEEARADGQRARRERDDPDDGGSMVPFVDEVVRQLVDVVWSPVVLGTLRALAVAGGRPLPTRHDGAAVPVAVAIDPGVALFMLANAVRLFTYSPFQHWLAASLLRDASIAHLYVSSAEPARPLLDAVSLGAFPPRSPPASPRRAHLLRHWEEGDGRDTPSASAGGLAVDDGVATATERSGGPQTAPRGGAGGGAVAAAEPWSIRDGLLDLLASSDLRLVGGSLLALRELVRLSSVAPFDAAMAGLLPRSHLLVTTRKSGDGAYATVQGAASGAGEASDSSGASRSGAQHDPPLIPMSPSTPTAAVAASASAKRARSLTSYATEPPSAPSPFSLGRPKAGSESADGLASPSGRAAGVVQGGIRGLRLTPEREEIADATPFPDRAPSGPLSLRSLAPESFARYQAKADEFVLAILRVLCQPSPPRVADMCLAASLLVDHVYVPRTPGAGAASPCLSLDHALALKRAASAVAESIRMTCADVRSHGDNSDAAAALLHFAERVSDDAARNGPVLARGAHDMLALLGEPLGVLQAQASAGRAQDKAIDVLRTLASLGASQVPTPETAELLFPPPLPRAGSDSQDASDSVRQRWEGCLPDSVQTGAMGRLDSPGARVSHFSRQLQQALVLRSVMLGLHGTGIEELRRAAYESSSLAHSPSRPADAPVRETEVPTWLPDVQSGVWTVDPWLLRVAPPFDSIEVGNTFTLSSLPWFLATYCPVVLPPRASEAEANAAVQSCGLAQRRLAIVLGQSYLVLAEVLQPRATARTVVGEAAPQPGSPRVRGRAVLVSPLHFTSVHRVSATSPVVRVRLLSGTSAVAFATDLGEELVQSPGHGAGSNAVALFSRKPTMGLRAFSFTLVMDHVDIAHQCVTHVQTVSERIRKGKLDALAALDL